MPFPEVLELDGYWAKYPPPHIALRGIVVPKGSTGNIPPTMTDAEKRIMDNGNVLPFKSLPPTIQSWLKETATNGR